MNEKNVRNADSNVQTCENAMQLIRKCVRIWWQTAAVYTDYVKNMFFSKPKNYWQIYKCNENDRTNHNGEIGRGINEIWSIWLP